MRVPDEPDIYAVGECAQHRGEMYGLVAPLWEQAKVLADHITGANPQRRVPRLADRHEAQGGRRRRRLDGPQGAGARRRRDVVFSEPRKGVYKSVIIRDDRLVGATLLGDVRKVAFLMQAFDRGLPLPEERVELLFDLGGPPAEVSAAELADDAQVCNCNGVTKGTIARPSRAAARRSPG